jgi:hypothetical protein
MILFTGTESVTFLCNWSERGKLTAQTSTLSQESRSLQTSMLVPNKKIHFFSHTAKSPGKSIDLTTINGFSRHYISAWTLSEKNNRRNFRLDNGRPTCEWLLGGSRFPRKVAFRYRNPGCQMVRFQTKNTDLGKFWRVLRWKMLVYFMAIWHILRLFGIIRVNLVYFTRFGKL